MITSAANVPEAQLRAAMTAAFADYAVPMNPSSKAFALMMRSRSLAPELSQLLWADGEIAAFWFVGRRGARAYLISSGTLPAFRRRGLSRELGLVALDAARRHRVRSFQTEVLENNAGAQALYEALGFGISRKLGCSNLSRVAKSSPHWDDTITVSSEQTSYSRHPADVLPSWQNETASLQAAGDAAKWLTISDSNGVAGYAAVIPAQSSLAQIAVRPDRRRQGVGSALIARARKVVEGESLRVLNVDERSDSLVPFLQSCGAARTIGQFELMLEL